MSLKQFAHSAARFNDRSATEAANAIQSGVQQQFANGLTMLQLLRQPLGGTGNEMGQIMAALQNIERRLSALES